MDKLIQRYKSLLSVIAQSVPFKPNFSRLAEIVGLNRETFFLNQLAQAHEVFASDKADFVVETFTFEVGGKNKGQARRPVIPAA